VARWVRGFYEHRIKTSKKGKKVDYKKRSKSTKKKKRQSTHGRDSSRGKQSRFRSKLPGETKGRLVGRSRGGTRTILHNRNHPWLQWCQVAKKGETRRRKYLEIPIVKISGDKKMVKHKVGTRTRHP